MEAPDNGCRHVVQFVRSFAGCFLEAMVQVRGIAASAWRRFVPFLLFSWLKLQRLDHDTRLGEAAL